MRLASDDITIRLVSVPIVLRPSLRAALRLTRKYVTFAAILKGITDGNLTIIADVITEGTSGQTEFLPTLTKRPILPTLASIQPGLIEFVLTLAGISEENSLAAKAPTTPVGFTDHFEHLFSIATGMLGWTPAEAWHATPAEIIAAHKGRIDLLRMIFGGGEAENEKRAELSLDDKARLAFSSIGIRKAG